MKHIYLNLKRFDISEVHGGVNRIAPMIDWGSYIIRKIQKTLKKYQVQDVGFAMYFPEAHLLNAVKSLDEDAVIQIGCQGVYREDTQPDGNFGAFTTNRTANAAKEMGCTTTIIGHCEERKDKMGILAEAGVSDTMAVNRILNQEIKAAVNAGLHVLYCIGENAEEQGHWQSVLKQQLEIGLKDVDTSNVTIAYEPVWAIGPGKTPPDSDYITMMGKFIKLETGNLDVVYGGGLKAENAEMIASIPEIDGGLIALTRFQGDVGFYPEEYLDIVDAYLKNESIAIFGVRKGSH